MGEEYVMIIFVLILLMIIISNAQVASKNNFNKEYCSIEQTNVVKGIFVLLVLLRHGSQYLNLKGELDIPYMTMDSHLNQMVVAMFLFYSGFGMMKSIMKKRYSYIRTLPVKRFLIVVLNFDIAVALFWMMNICLKIHYDWKTILLSFTGWLSIGNSNWYMFAIFVLYILLFASFYFLKWFDKDLSLYIGMVIFSILSILFVYWEIRVGQPTWFYNTVILFALGGWFALFQSKIENIIMKNDSVYITSGAILAILYWASFKNRWNGIEAYSIWAIIFTLAVVMVTMKVNIESNALEWLGRKVFSVYILQRIPMVIFSKTGYVSNSPYAFIVLSFLTTLGLAVIFDYLVGRLDKKILKCLLRE